MQDYSKLDEFSLPPDATPEALDAILKNYAHKCDNSLLELIAKHPNTTPEALDAILKNYAHKCDNSLLRIIAKHPNTMPEVLDAILKNYAHKFNGYDGFSLLTRIVEHHNTTPEVLDTILKNYSHKFNGYDGFSLLTKIVEHHNATLEVLDATLTIYSHKFKDHFKKEILDLIATDCAYNGYPYLLTTIITNKHVTPEFLIKIIQHQNFSEITKVDKITIIHNMWFHNKNHLILWNFKLLKELPSNIYSSMHGIIVEKIKNNTKYLMKSINKAIYSFMGDHTNSSFKKNSGIVMDLLQLDWFRESQDHIDKLPQKVLLFDRIENKIKEQTIEEIYGEAIKRIKTPKIS